jgi:hypothetical protein
MTLKGAWGTRPRRRPRHCSAQGPLPIPFGKIQVRLRNSESPRILSPLYICSWPRGALQLRLKWKRGSMKVINSAASSSRPARTPQFVGSSRSAREAEKLRLRLHQLVVCSRFADFTVNENVNGIAGAHRRQPVSNRDDRYLPLQRLN